MGRLTTTPLEAEILSSVPQGVFSHEEVRGLPSPVARYFRASITSGAPLARAARLEMRGHIRIGRWLSFTATEVLDPQRGFLWRARVAGRLIVGSDRYFDQAAEMNWRFLGLVPVVRAQGPDLARSAAARAGGEGMWLPTAMLPRFGVEWTAESDDAVTARFSVGHCPMEIHYQLDDHGRVRSVLFNRWGDPERSGTWGWHRFGGDVTAYHTFAGLAIPSAGRFGWHYGTSRWSEGEFFRYVITELQVRGTLGEWRS